MVTPNSRLRFRILDQSTFRKDAVIGQKTVNLSSTLSCYDGKLENLELTLDVPPEKITSLMPPSVGKLIVFLNDLTVNVQSTTAANPLRPSSSWYFSLLSKTVYHLFLEFTLIFVRFRNLRIWCLWSYSA